MTALDRLAASGAVILLPRRVRWRRAWRWFCRAVDLLGPPALIGAGLGMCAGTAIALIERWPG